MLKKLHFNDFLCPVLAGAQTQMARSHQLNHLLMLNSNSFSARIAAHIWPACGVRVCADGAANRLHDAMGVGDRAAYVPDFILGDLDSLRADVSAYYTNLGTQVTLLEDQEENDMDKSVMHIRSLLDEKGEKGGRESTLIVLGAQGGRFDHEMAAISSLFRWQGAFSRVLLLSEDSCTSLLSPGLHCIRPVRSSLVREGETCGLLPIGGPVRSVTTCGLQWNLQAEALALGVRISSSNAIPAGSEEVTVQTSEPVLWTMQCNFNFQE
ncbi:thiamine pyrophosphokinase [Ochromonadaceae sp. CCMP2298]|nr:thiamine pyrophosphokinase [Ochromonadaceae sp. CCMP2298]